MNNQEILKSVVEYYHTSFLESREAISYLASRGINDDELLRKFKVGYSSGSLLSILPQDSGDELIAVLKQVGILKDDGTETLKDCIVFPVYDPNDNIAAFYGRRITGQMPLHVWVPNDRRPVWNYRAMKSASQVILVSGITDALSCMIMGLGNAVPIYDTGLTPEHIQMLKDYRTEKVFLCFGNKVVEHRLSMKEKITSLGIDTYELDFAKEYEDINAALISGFRKNQFVDLIKSAYSIFGELKPTVSKTDDGLFIDFGRRSYRIKGITTKNLEQMKVNIKVCDKDNFHIDTPDLYTAKSRSIFIKQIRKIMPAKESEIERELLCIIGEVEKVWGESIMAGETIAGQEMTESEKEQAVACLKDPNLMGIIKQGFEVLGYVGDDSVKIITFLVAISRKIDQPLSCTIVSQNGAGKSFLIDTILELTPEEEYVHYNRISPQALLYVDEHEFENKVLVIEEKTGNGETEMSIKSLQTRKKITLALPVRDPVTAKIKTVTHTINGNASVIMTARKPNSGDDDASLCLELYLDESKFQTELIHEAQKEAMTLESLSKKDKQKAVIRKIRSIQRLLKDVKVIIPFASELKFPAEWVRTRRDHVRFLNLIKIITFLHQYQRPLKTSGGRDYIESTVDDYAIAYGLAKDLFGETFRELKKPQRELLNTIEKLSDTTDVITRREVRQQTGMQDYSLRKLLGDLVNLEYLTVTEGKQGKCYYYKLSERNVDSEKVVIGLTTPLELMNRLAGPGYQ